MKDIFEPAVPEWTTEAICAQVSGDLWFPKKGANGPMVAIVRSMCAGCPVRRQCLEHAIATEEQHGIWGGLTTKERRQLIRDREAA